MADAIEPAASEAAEIYRRLRKAAAHVLAGQESVFELLSVALITQGHVLLEGVPGTGKTLMAKLLARLVRADFRRIQFTPDLLPADVVGTNVFDLQTSKFYLKRGPIFTQILLADEINRAPAKTQSALLEAMEERQVTLEGDRYPLDRPFFVVATQNPVEYEGTYPLPEAQLDRFLFKLLVTYPSREEEREVLRMYDRGLDPRALDVAGVEPVISPPDLERAIQQVGAVTVDQTVVDYVLSIVAATRESRDVALGGSPRAAIGLMMSAKTLAAIRGRSFVIPDDIKELAAPVLRHRLILRAEAEIEGVTPDVLIERLLTRVPVPR